MGAPNIPLYRSQEGLLAAAAFAVILAAAFFQATPVEPPASVRGDGAWDLLYRGGWGRQATGFGVLACSLAAAALSLRRRCKRIQYGGFDRWRMLHAAVGAAALAILITHTGLRLGSGFNRALTIVFLSANVVGAAAAAGLGHPSARWMVHLHAAYDLAAPGHDRFPHPGGVLLLMRCAPNPFLRSG